VKNSPRDVKLTILNTKKNSHPDVVSFEKLGT
jgi:hypothetical protein